MRSISLNTDIGEGFGSWRIADDEELLRLVTDANVACGFHAGDPDILRTTCRVAAERGVGVGAQVGFADLRGFGRRQIDVPRASLTNDVIYQVGALQALARASGTAVSYVKAHGALYHASNHDDSYAEAILDAVVAMGGSSSTLPVLCQPQSRLAALALARGIAVWREGYADRACGGDGMLVPRGTPGAVITDPATAAERAVAMVTTGRVAGVDGRDVAMTVDSLCVHSDSPGAVSIAAAVAQGLRDAGVELASLTAATLPVGG